MYIKATLVAALALGVVVSAEAQPAPAAPVIADVHKPLFQQFQNLRRYTRAWTKDDVTPLRAAIIRDSVIDPAEQAILNQLRTGTFSFVLRGRQEALFKPNDIQLTGTVEPDGVALLAISAADLSASVTQQPNESRAAFLVRRRGDGMIGELATLAATDATARVEARKLLAERFFDLHKQGVKIDLRSAASLVRNGVAGELGASDTLPPQQKQAYRSLLAEAAAKAVRENYVSYEGFAALFSSPQTAEAEVEALANQLGLKRP